jgi:SAM-dependent methyltransferase
VPGIAPRERDAIIQGPARARCRGGRRAACPTSVRDPGAPGSVPRSAAAGSRGPEDMEPNAPLPLPPLPMRALVGPTSDEAFDNPDGRPVVAGLPESAWDFVFDFGCGCGRLARQMIQQTPRPRRYLGVDLHAGMIRWCQTHLRPVAPGFEFSHQNVFNRGLNPAGTMDADAFPVAAEAVSLLLGWSVFTHVLERPAEFYLREVARVLRPDGFALLSFFLFDKADFPMMQGFQNALFINDVDPSNAVIFDKGWLRSRVQDSGLVLEKIEPPAIRGFQWVLRLRRRESGAGAVEFPADTARSGSAPPPLLPMAAERIGLDDD